MRRPAGLIGFLAVAALAGGAQALPRHHHRGPIHRAAHHGGHAAAKAPDKYEVAAQELRMKTEAENAAVIHQFELSSLRERQDYTAQARQYGQHNLDVLKLQNWLTIWITVVMVFIIISAMLLTTFQLAMELRTNSLTSTLKVSKDGIEMSSSVVGFFVLLAALFVFYFYLKQVYKIERLQSGSAQVDSNGDPEAAPATASGPPAAVTAAAPANGTGGKD